MLIDRPRAAPHRPVRRQAPLESMQAPLFSSWEDKMSRVRCPFLVLILVTALVLSAGNSTNRTIPGLLAAAPGTASASGATAEAAAVAPFVGEWVGTGWGSEVRFKQTRSEFVRQMAGGRLPPGAGGEETIMSLTVKHATSFIISVQPDGSIVGEGQIVYDLFPNLCGVAALTRQVNEAVDRMELMPRIFKLATEVGSRSVQRFHAHWYEEEAKLAREIRGIEHAVREYERLGGPARGALAAKDSPAMQKIATSLLLKTNQPADTRALVSAVVFDKCRTPLYRFPGSSNPCLDLFVRPIEQELKTAGEIAFEAARSQIFELLNEEAKRQMLSLNGRAKAEAAGCAAAPDALRGGTAVGPETLAELGLHMGAVGAKAAADMALGGAPVGLILSIPGVTQVQYSYKGLPEGPEARRFQIKGRLEPAGGDTARMHLEMDGDVTGGDKNLYVEYTVNYKREKRPFPTWSPFLDKPGDARKSGTERVLERRMGADGREFTVAQDVPRGTPFVNFSARGAQRNGVRVWHEYEYFWNAHKIVEPIPAGNNPVGPTPAYR
jgi:hypothetical protein